MLALLLLASFHQGNRTNQDTIAGSYIVQAASLDQAQIAVQDIRGNITHELGIINAVAARLDSQQRETLKLRGFTLHKDSSVEISGTAVVIRSTSPIRVLLMRILSMQRECSAKA